VIIWFISAMLRFAITGAADVNRSGDWPWMRRSSGWSFRPSSRIASRWRWALLNNSNAERRCLSDSGRCGSSGRAMKLRGLSVNTRCASRRTVWWREISNAFGRPNSEPFQGAAAAIGVKASIIHRWLRGGLLDARQSGKGGAWKIRLTEEQISCLWEYARLPQAKRRRKTLLRQLTAGEQSK